MTGRVGTRQDLKELSDDGFYCVYEQNHDALGAAADHAGAYSGRKIPGVAGVAGNARAAWNDLSDEAARRGVYPEVTDENRDELHSKARELVSGMNRERLEGMSDAELRKLRENSVPRLYMGVAIGCTKTAAPGNRLTEMVERKPRP